MIPGCLPSILGYLTQPSCSCPAPYNIDALKMRDLAQFSVAGKVHFQRFHMLPYLQKCDPPSEDKRWKIVAATMRKLGNER